MTVMMLRAKIKPECIPDVEAAVTKTFTAIEHAQLQGVRYASCRLTDGVTYVILLQLDDATNNPLPTVPAFQEFQANLPNWLAEPPSPEQLTVVGSYRLF